jgi:hypothetical protein
MVEFAEAHLFFLVAGLAALTVIAAVSAYRELSQRRPNSRSAAA